MINRSNSLGHPNDIKAAIVVFLVALPLCLGIALASGAPAFSGIVAGIIGGIVIGAISGANLSVSGPAAGLTSIVLASINSLPSFEVFLVAVFLSGIFQILFGALRLGSFTGFIPSSVILGMLAAIGLILIMKQIPHAVGFDKDFEGDESFLQSDGHNTITEIFYAITNPSPGAVIICVLGIAMLLLWDTTAFKKNKILSAIPAPLLVVIMGVGLNLTFGKIMPSFQLQGEHLVDLPRITNTGSLMEQLRFPDFETAIGMKEVWIIAITISMIASIESLLSIEATDRMDPDHNVTPSNRELIAQGAGNTISGLLGGIPVTAVIVRSSANISAGGKTKLSAILHGILLLVSILAIPGILNLIPKAALAAILLMVGYKLTSVKIIKEQFNKGRVQFIPFAITACAILFTDLLFGIGIGLVVGIFFVLKENFHSAIHVTQSGNLHLIKMNKDVSFLNKPLIREKLDKIPHGSKLLIDGTQATFIDLDVREEIKSYLLKAKNRNIEVELKNIRLE